MIPFGALAGSAHARQAELEGGEYWQQVLSGVLGGMAEVATEMPVYTGITKLLQSTGAMKTVNQGAQQLLQTHGQKAIEFLKDLALQSWQEAEMVPLEKAVKQVLGFPQDWSIKPLIKEMGEEAKGGLAMALIMGALGGGYIGVNQVINESIQRQEPPEITVQRVIAQVEEETPIINQEAQAEEITPSLTQEEQIETPKEDVYYHGSDVNIEKFDISKAKKWNKFGHFFTTDPEAAKDYGNIINKAVVKLNNPKVITQKQWWDIRGEHAKDDVWFSNWKKELQGQGYDGLRVLPEETKVGKYTVKTPEIVVAFEDSQVEVIKEHPAQETLTKKPEEQELTPPKQEKQVEPWQQSLKEYAPETPPEGISAENYRYIRQTLIEEWQESVREAYGLGKPIPQEILSEYPEFVEEIKLKEATKEQEAEIQKELNEYKKQIHKAILRLGGINDKDYKDIPLYLKRKTGRGLDELVLEMQGEGYQVENADDLYALIQESKGIKPVVMSSKEKEIRQKYFKVPAVVGTGELKERGLSAHIKNRIIQKQTEIDFEDQALYQQADFKTMAQKVDQIFSANPEQGLKIAMGEEPPPEGTLAGMYWTAAENQAILNKDTKTLKKLMNSKINEVATALGQNIAAFRERNPLSPIRIVKEINKTLEKQFVKRKPTITIQEAVKKQSVMLKQDIEKTTPNLDAVLKPNINTWEKFINSITC
ncbi:MAG: DUF3990 domain-containing protein [SAR324 cluster bacterium]|uniref:DUF3990 domain-containing protein n=1 Tax=SAR324 cluster bacterium TaxID=2024889 RepID=A0A7X9FP59_9DELT|nr:DUF3990 domain-containing protein [SAR324 cluster bacterium]